MRTAAPCASVTFQRPETRNKSESRIAAAQFSAVFQPGNSSEASPPRGCAILSVMVLIVALSSILKGLALAWNAGGRAHQRRTGG